MLPRIRITDLLSEVARWTLFTDCFTHLRTGETAADERVLMASLLADGLNLGLTRMADACAVASLSQLAWTADWHIRDETYALALRRAWSTSSSVSRWRRALSEQRQVVWVGRSKRRPKRRFGREGAPLGQRGGAPLFVNLAGDEMALLIEMVVDLGMN